MGTQMREALPSFQGAAPWVPASLLLAFLTPGGATSVWASPGRTVLEISYTVITVNAVVG